MAQLPIALSSRFNLQVTEFRSFPNDTRRFCLHHVISSRKRRCNFRGFRWVMSLVYVFFFIRKPPKTLDSQPLVTMPPYLLAYFYASLTAIVVCVSWTLSTHREISRGVAHVTGSWQYNFLDHVLVFEKIYFVHMHLNWVSWLRDKSPSRKIFVLLWRWAGTSTVNGSSFPC